METTARTAPFVKTSNGPTGPDEAALARARALIGLKGYVTSNSVTLTPADEVISSYRDLWHVEQSFRISKPTCVPGRCPTAPGTRSRLT